MSVRSRALSLTLCAAAPPAVVLTTAPAAAGQSAVGAGPRLRRSAWCAPTLGRGAIVVGVTLRDGAVVPPGAVVVTQAAADALIVR